MSVMPRTMHLIADKGTTFTNSFVSNNLCCPSRATFLTGQYSHNNGIWSNSPPNGGYSKFDGSNTLPLWLQTVGYHTVHIGKYLNGYGSSNQTDIPPGWDDWFGLVDPSTYTYYGYTLNEHGVLHRYDDDGSGSNYQTDVLAQKAVDFIERTKNDSTPFFLNVAFLAPHQDQSEDREEGIHMSGPTPALRHKGAFADAQLPRSPNFNEEDVSDKPTLIRNLPLLSAEDIQEMEAHFRRRRETLLAVDEAVQKIADALDATGKLDKTVLIFTSDNGYFHGEHRIKSGKIYLYDEGIRVPVMMSGPMIPHQNIDSLVVNVDLAPTIVDLAQATPGRVTDGLSLMPLIKDQTIVWRTDFLIEGVDNRFQALRTNTALYAEFRNGDKELYDLVNDPYELNNIAGQSAYAELQTRLAARLAQLKEAKGAAQFGV